VQTSEEKQACEEYAHAGALEERALSGNETNPHRSVLSHVLCM